MLATILGIESISSSALLLTGLGTKLHNYMGDETLAVFGGALMAVPILLMPHVSVQPGSLLPRTCLGLSFYVFFIWVSFFGGCVCL